MFDAWARPTTPSAPRPGRPWRFYGVRLGVLLPCLEAAGAVTSLTGYRDAGNDSFGLNVLAILGLVVLTFALAVVAAVRLTRPWREAVGRLPARRERVLVVAAVTVALAISAVCLTVRVRWDLGPETVATAGLEQVAPGESCGSSLCVSYPYLLPVEPELSARDASDAVRASYEAQGYERCTGRGASSVMRLPSGHPYAERIVGIRVADSSRLRGAPAAVQGLSAERQTQLVLVDYDVSRLKGTCSFV